MKKLYPLLLVFILSITSLFSQTPFASYPLDGNAHDASGTWSGIITGTPTTVANRYSQSARALQFNGTSDYIDLPNDFDFPSRTIIAWFNVSGLPSGNGNVIYASDHGAIRNGNTFIMVYNVGGVPTLRLGTSGNSLSFDTAANYNTWYQAAVVRTPTLGKLYINGRLVATTVNPDTLHAPNGVNHATIGCDRNHSGMTIGKIDDILIYNTALSDTAIATNYNAWTDSIVRITGKLYFDSNQNHIFDPGEQPVRNQLINIGTDYEAITNASGEYVVYPLPGTYVVKPALSGNISVYSFSPDSIILAADSQGVTYADNNFGINAPANYCEGAIAIVAVTPPARPGFNNWVNVRFVNAISAAAVSQTIRFRYAPQQSYVSATPTPTSVDTLNHLVTWDITNLGSGSLWQAMVSLHTPQVAAIGSILRMSMAVTNSTCAMLESPFETVEDVIVVGSFDPNDKAVSPVGMEPGGRIQPTSELGYTIRFQNTGTYAAENVNVIDTISPFLNLTTLKVQAASHNYEVLVNGRTVTFRFSNINLPDSNANEPMSHGYIKYTIEPAGSFVQNSAVHNFADIYFDFNAPVRTNTTTNTADNSVGILNIAASDIGFEVYPNPLANGNWSLKTDLKMNGKEFKIFDATGRIVYTSRITDRQSEINGSNFPQGVYLVKIENYAMRLIKL